MQSFDVFFVASIGEIVELAKVKDAMRLVWLLWSVSFYIEA